MDVNRCVHVGLSLYLVTFIDDLRYKMLLISACAMHRQINNSVTSKVNAYVFWPVKRPVRTLYKHISLKLMVKFINLR